MEVDISWGYLWVGYHWAKNQERVCYTLMPEVEGADGEIEVLGKPLIHRMKHNVKPASILSKMSQNISLFRQLELDFSPQREAD